MEPGRAADFRRLWAGQAVSQMGSTITSVGLPLAAVILLGATPFQMGLLSGAGAAAILLCGLFAGAWADRLRRRPILIFADLGRAAVLGTIPLAAVFHRLNMPYLYLAAVANGALTILFQASYQAYVPSLVERENIVEANSKLTLAQSIAEAAGPGLTGVLVQWITAPMAILFDAVSFLASAFSIWLIRQPEPEPPRGPQTPLTSEIAEGLRAVWRDPILRALALRTATAALFGGFFASLYFVFAVRELGLSAALLGLIISLGGASSLLGSAMAGRLARRFGFGRTLIGASILAGFSALLAPLAHGTVALCAAFLSAAQLFDIAWPVYHITELSLRQTITPDRLLGRVNAAMNLLFQGGVPLGALAAGAIAQLIGMRSTMFAGALGFLLSTLWLVFSPVRRVGSLPEHE